jgi:hypothetical protein
MACQNNDLRETFKVLSATNGARRDSELCALAQQPGPERGTPSKRNFVTVRRRCRLDIKFILNP